jgi:2-polyprenyl-3-methyl-5-hydroxy-6-metoxy-1,4-benzoquinol methylase
LHKGPQKDIQDIVDEYARANEDGIEVLDAGCGCGSRIRFPGNTVLAGIDINPEQLEKNDRIHKKILGDIQTYTTDERYDLTFCWDLLEHLEHPEEAVTRLLTWTKPGGLIIISVPNAVSLKGMITKLSPYAFHKWVYRDVYQYDHKPFRTYMRRCIAPKHLCAFFKGHRIEYTGFEDHLFKRSYLNTIYRSITTLIRVLSLGRYDPGQAQFYLVVRKTG